MPVGARVATFHMLGDAFLRAQGITPDYASPGLWDEMETALSTADLPETWMYDVLTIEEAQDFSIARRVILPRMLKEGGRAIWLEDPNQNLYGRETVPPPGWVTLHSNANYRSPRQIVELLTSNREPRPAVEVASSFEGADIETLAYPGGDTEAMLAQTKHAITRYLAAGFKRQDIAIASFQDGRAQRFWGAVRWEAVRRDDAGAVEVRVLVLTEWAAELLIDRA